MNWLALIGQVAGSALGEQMSAMDKATAMSLIQSSLDDLGKIDVPKLKELVLQHQAKSELGGIKDDPAYRAQQQAADAQLGDVVDSGGLTLADRANLNAIRNKTASTESAGRNAILGGMAARGTLDSGTQVAAQLQGNQQAANELAAAGEHTAGAAQARAFAAIGERARQAGAGLDRDYRRQSDAARAQDAINAGNVAIANSAAKYNAGLPQQNFNNALTLAGAKINPTQILAGAHAANAKDTQQMWQGLGNAAGAAGSAAANSASKSGGSSNTGDYSGSDLNTPGFDQATNDGVASQPSEWNSYPGDALSGPSTRNPDPDIIGYTADGKPIRRSAQGQNF